MRAVYKKLGLAGLILAGLVVAGCLVSGTFVIVEDVDFNFTANDTFYWYPVDLRENTDWADHQDDIDDIDAVGFEFTIENTSATPSTFTVQFAAATGVANTLVEPTEIPDDAVTVITGLLVGAHATKTVTYAESVGMVSNLAALKAIIKSGRFDYYGTSSGGSGDFPFEVTHGKIIITVSASGA
jgi:hypothetical protein